LYPVRKYPDTGIFAKQAVQICRNTMRIRQWDDLRIFLEVARHGRLTAAARALGLDHSTVSRRLDGLESGLARAWWIDRPAARA
jgi:DNA-binding MarR family transcriptional regulator